jgi:hypothetical protein
VTLDGFPYASYDRWLTTPPEPDYRPLRCSHCHERVEDIENYSEGEGHCPDPDDGSVYYGRLEWDWTWSPEDDGPDPDDAYDRMRDRELEGW